MSAFLGRKIMSIPELRKALESTRELEITVTGKKTGRSISLPVWFVHEGNKILLLPLKGSQTKWFRNITKTPTMSVAVKGAGMTAKAKTVTGTNKVNEIVEKFRKKYSAGEVKKYYSNFDAYVELNLP